ncbi:MAG TPA: cupin domain-containing protein [Chloroflexota bacterium]|nr:cupin domain-containing protein [Chloroflexota bacterium]
MATNLTTERGCSYVAPDGGERFFIFDDEVGIKVEGDETAGAYAMVTITVAPGGGPPLHAHPGPETLVVLSGEFAFTRREAGGVATLRAGPGAVVHAPGGAPHRFENVSATPSSLLCVFAPETADFLRELGAAFPRGAESSMETMLTLSAKSHIESFYGDEGSRPEPPKDGATSEQARTLAWRFEQANDALVATIKACPPEQWRALCADTGWSVAVQAHHVADNHAHIAAAVQHVADGQPYPPMTVADQDAMNARHAAAFADVSQAETIALLESNGAVAARTYRRLTDEQLALTFESLVGVPPVSVAGFIAYVAIGEIERHGKFLREAIGI